MKARIIYLILSIVFYITMIPFIKKGFYHLYVYSGANSIFPANAYVGGDAYNYIINAGKANAYFTVALIFCIIASTFLLIFFNYQKKEIKTLIEKTEN